MIRALICAALIGLAGCQGIVGPNGEITGVTVPPGCSASGEITFGMAVQGSARFDCQATPVAKRFELK